MADFDTRSDLIRRYLLGQLTETEQADFQTQLLFDTDLRQQVQVLRAAQKIARADQTIAASPRPSFRLWAAVLVLLLGLSVGAYLYFAKEKTPVQPAVPPAEQPVPPLQTPPVDTPTRPSTPAHPIAAAFRPNPALEQYRTSGSNLRGKSLQVTLSQPRDGARLHAADQSLLLQVAGKIDQESGDALPPLRVHLFSNMPAAYANFKPRWSADLLPEAQKENSSGFQEQVRLHLPAGLYYLLVEDAESGAVLKVTAFQVIPAE